MPPLLCFLPTTLHQKVVGGGGGGGASASIAVEIDNFYRPNRWSLTSFTPDQSLSPRPIGHTNSTKHTQATPGIDLPDLSALVVPAPVDANGKECSPSELPPPSFLCR